MSKKDEFPEEVLAEVEMFQLSEALLAGREEAVGVTIDSATSQDLDDAIFVSEQDGLYQVQVSIADVASLVQPDTVSYKQALARVETRYLRGYNIPMLPRPLSENMLSLLEDALRPALTFYIELNPVLEVENLSIKETVIRNRRKLSYGQVDQIINHQPDDPDYTMLVTCNNLAELLLEKRRNKGALAIYDIKRHLYTNEEGQVLPLSSERAHKANLIVQELMILTNQVTAKFFARQEIPILFRNHTVTQSTPDREEIMAQFNAALLNPNLISALGQRTQLWFNRATYDPFLKGHFGLNEVAYTHVTSPIRRLADLINHHNIKAFLNQQPVVHTHADLEELSVYINERVAQVKDERGEYLRKQAYSQAQMLAQYASFDDFVTMDSTEFKQVVKQACRTDSLSEDLERAIMIRFEQNEIDVIQLFSILFESVSESAVWQRMREHALAYARNVSGFPNQLLNLQAQKGDLADVDTEVKEGPQGYLGRVIVTLGGNLVSTPEYAVGSNKRDALHTASHDFLLCFLADTLVPAAQTTEPPLKIGATTPINIVSSVEENYVGELNEFCSVRPEWPLPIYDFKQSGPPHQPTIICECVVSTRQGTFLGKGIGTNKKAAKQTAAGEVLKQIAADKPVSPEPLPSIELPEEPPEIEENYVGVLNEKCQRRGTMLPIYQFYKTGPAHNPEFTCTLMVQTVGGTLEVTSAGPNKKLAKQTAAKKCLEQI